QAIVKGVEIAAEILGKIHRLGDGAQYGRAAARPVAIGHQQCQAEFARGLDHGLFLQTVMLERAAPIQLALQRRLAISRHAWPSLKKPATSSIRRIVSA